MNSGFILNILAEADGGQFTISGWPMGSKSMHSSGERLDKGYLSGTGRRLQTKSVWCLVLRSPRRDASQNMSAVADVSTPC